MSVSMINQVLGGAVNTPNSVDTQIQIAMKSMANSRASYRNRTMFKLLMILLILFIFITNVTQFYSGLGVILLIGVVILRHDYNKHADELAVLDAELSALYTLAERFNKK